MPVRPLPPIQAVQPSQAAKKYSYSIRYAWDGLNLSRHFLGS